MSGFAGASITKAWITSLGSMSLLSTVLPIKSLTRLRISPHITRKLQIWRLFTSTTCFHSPTELLLATLLIYHMRVVERLFGSHKYAAFLFVVGWVSKALEVVLVLLLRVPRLNSIVSGPYAILAALIYQFYWVVPPTSTVQVFGLNLTNKLGVYLVAAQLIFARYPYNLVPTVAGVLASMMYSKNIANLKHWRFPAPAVDFINKWIAPYVASAPASADTDTQVEELELRQQQHHHHHHNLAASTPTLTRTQGPQISEDHVETLQAMCPQKSREEIVAALVESGNDPNQAALLLL